MEEHMGTVDYQFYKDVIMEGLSEYSSNKR
jgi:hypothetical protein